MSTKQTFTVLFGGSMQLNPSPEANQIESLADAEAEYTRMVHAGHKVVKLVEYKEVRSYDADKVWDGK